MDSLSTAQWVSRIEDTAHDRLPWNSKADCSPWDGFYRDYVDAAAECRQTIDQAFLTCLDSDDLRVLDAAVSHMHSLPPTEAVAQLQRLLTRRNTFLLAQADSGSQPKVLARVLNVMAACACAAGVASHPGVRDAILAWAPRAGPLQSGVGTFFGGLGPQAVDALVSVLPDGVDNSRMLVDAGYELHRNPDVWQQAIKVAETWPVVMGAAMLRGGAEHAARFPAG